MYFKNFRLSSWKLPRIVNWAAIVSLKGPWSFQFCGPWIGTRPCGWIPCTSDRNGSWFLPKRTRTSRVYSNRTISCRSSAAGGCALATSWVAPSSSCSRWRCCSIFGCRSRPDSSTTSTGTHRSTGSRWCPIRIRWTLPFAARRLPPLRRRNSSRRYIRNSGFIVLLFWTTPFEEENN